MSGDIVEALADGGLFQLRGVLIGTVAFSAISGLLGVRLPMTAILTGVPILRRTMPSPGKSKIACLRSSSCCRG
nr:GSU2403 family nucleotidyltransferase fold protein [Rhizobium sp. BK181]